MRTHFIMNLCFVNLFPKWWMSLKRQTLGNGILISEISNYFLPTLAVLDELKLMLISESLKHNLYYKKRINMNISIFFLRTLIHFYKQIVWSQSTVKFHLWHHLWLFFLDLSCTSSLDIVTAPLLIKQCLLHCWF